MNAATRAYYVETGDHDEVEVETLRAFRDEHDDEEPCLVCGEPIRDGDTIIQPNMQDVAHASCAGRAA